MQRPRRKHDKWIYVAQTYNENKTGRKFHTNSRNLYRTKLAIFRTFVNVLVILRKKKCK